MSAPLKFMSSRLYHKIDTQPEVRLRVGAFDVGVLVFSAAAIFLASVHGKCLRYTEDVDVVFAKKNSSLLTLERGRWIRMLCDSSNLHKQKLVKPNGGREKSGTKKWRSRTSGWVSILRRRTNARNVRLYYPYWQYTDLFIFRFVILCLCRLAHVASRMSPRACLAIRLAHLIVAINTPSWQVLPAVFTAGFFRT